MYVYVFTFRYRMQELRDSSLEFLIEKFLIKGNPELVYPKIASI